MKELFIKQKVFSLRDRFDITDEFQNQLYFVEGSWLKLLKSFSIYNTDNEMVAKLQHEFSFFLSAYTLEINDLPVAQIKQRFSFFRMKLDIVSEGVLVSGDLFELNFSIEKHGKEIAKINKKILSWGDTYQLTLFDESEELLALGIVLAIDYIKQSQAASASSS